MRYFFTLITLVTVTITKTYSQIPELWTSFELSDSVYQSNIFIDTVTYPNNLWQIGKPQKAVFTSAFAGDRAFATDTLNYCPGNDTSVFYVKVPGWFNNWLQYGMTAINFKYQLDLDTGDICQLEISRDSGQTWVYYQNDLTLSSFGQDLTTSTSIWQNFSLFGFFTTSMNQFDSITFRFTYISDSNASGKDGWIIDDLHFYYWYSGIDEIANRQLTLYPNPSSGHIKLTSKTGTLNGTIQVTNLSGQTVYQTNHIPTTGDLHLSLPDGLYILKYTDDKTTTAQKLIIQH